MVSGRRLVVIYLIDGAREDVIRELIDAGELPNIRRELMDQGCFRTAASCLPSTTGPAHLPFLTGCFPGTLNIPGIRWFDKRVYHERRFSLQKFRSYNGIEAPLMNSDLPRNRPTIFECVEKPFAIYSLITRGLPARQNATRFSKPFMYLKAHITDRWHPVDRLAHDRLLGCLDEEPDYVFAVFPGVDSYSHLKHPTSEQTLEAYRYADYSIGKAVEKLKRQGRWDDTLLIVTSDHGMSHTENHFDLARFLQHRGIRTMYYPVIWKRNPEAAVMISGNALGMIYLLDHGNTLPLRGSLVREALGPILDELINHEEIDFLAWRGLDSSYEVLSARGSASITRAGNTFRYSCSGGNPFGFDSRIRDGFLERHESLQYSFMADYPDAMVQLHQLFSSPRSGDLIVVSKNGYDLRKNYEWPEHHGSHGSLHRRHMIVPLICNRGDWEDRPARTVDVFNTTLKWLGKPAVDDTDGIALS